MPAPNLLCAKLDRKHESWQNLYAFWEALRKLSEDDDLIMYKFAGQFLFKRSKEPPDVYAERCRHFHYPNHLKNIKGWYVSALFKQPPTVVLRKKDAVGEDAVVKEGPNFDQLSDFMDDVTGNGKPLVEFWQEKVQTKLLTYAQAFILFDVPAAPEFRNLAQQKAANALRPHLVAFDPQDVINWQHDEQGVLEWVVIKTRAVTQDTFDADIQLADRWYIYDRRQVTVYEYVIPQDQTNNKNWSSLDEVLGLGGNYMPTPYDSDATATLLAGYPRPHALADQGMVPIFHERLHPDLWIGKRVASPLLKLLNVENSHDWALIQNNLALLVIFTDREIQNVHASEVGFIQLAQADKASFIEQSGNAYKASSERIVELREELYRLAYLVSQGRSASASASMQSGYSKEQDMMPARDVLSAMGDQTRNALKKVLQAASDRMALDLEVDVSGFDFLDRGDVSQLEVIERGDTIAEINSETYRKERNKRIVGITLPDLGRETRQKIEDEITTTDTPEKVAEDTAADSQATSMVPGFGGKAGQTPAQALATRLQNTTRLNAPAAFRDADNAA